MAEKVEDLFFTFSVVRVLLATSHTTRPKAYMSAALNDSKLDLFRVSSKTSGAIYRLVPTRVFGAMSISLVSLSNLMEV